VVRSIFFIPKFVLVLQLGKWAMCEHLTLEISAFFFSFLSFHFTFVNAYWFYIVYRIFNDIIFDNSQ